MIRVNDNFKKLEKNYLFVDISNKVDEYQKKNPVADIIKLGIGDVTLPLCKSVTDEMHNAVDEMSSIGTFKGYGPSEGYDFLRRAISNNYLRFGVEISKKEIYVSDGAKSDTANISEIFSGEGVALVTDPSYPVYVDSSIIRGMKIEYIDATEENNFLPLPNYNISPSIIYMCSPNNPTGAAYTKEQLSEWVRYAIAKNSVIIFDTAYEAFIEDESLPHSIFEVEDAKKCAIEICSFSKSSGFTGMRCGYTVIPKELKIVGVSIGDVWLRRQSCKFNGVSYITQRAAKAALSQEGLNQTFEMIKYYKRNAKVLTDLFDKMNIWYIGGKNSPYIWVKCPNGMKSWEFFDYLLCNANVVGTPGSGFGKNGEGYFRFSSFGSYDNIIKAAERISKLKF